MGTYGAAPGIAPEEVRHAKLIVVWGNNVTWCNLHLTPLINSARRDGARVVVIDPKRVKIAEQADLHLALRPGTDVVLAWAIAAELERRAGSTATSSRVTSRASRPSWRRRAATPRGGGADLRVPEADIRQLAAWYHTLSPAAISVGNGLERNQNGGSGIRAVFALPALAGKWGVTGAGW